MIDVGALNKQPFVLYNNDGFIDVVMAKDEDQAWCYFLGWPTNEDIDEAKKLGYRVVPARVTYKRDD